MIEEEPDDVAYAILLGYGYLKVSEKVSLIKGITKKPWSANFAGPFLDEAKSELSDAKTVKASYIMIWPSRNQ